ncbi:hypothetical protein KL858_15310 [Mycolicibacterium goodii]|nr:hypothetical protein [Mycolicibacterium goodii]
MPFLSPATWNGIGIVTFLIIFVAGFVWALLTGRIVLGIHHREITGEQDRRIAALEKQLADKEATIDKFADAAARATVTAEVTDAVVKTLRNLAQERTL